MHIKIGDISLTKSWGTPSRWNSDFWWWNIPRVKSWELNDSTKVIKFSETITEAWINSSSATFFEKWTLLIAMYWATAWKLWILWIWATTNQAICSIQNTKWMFDEKFLFYQLLSLRSKIVRESTWWAQPNISKTYIDNFKIYLPPLQTQKAIARKLDHIQSLIEQKKEAIAKTEELGKSIFVEMFGDPVKNEKGFEINRVWELIKIKHWFAFKSQFFQKDWEHIILTPWHYLEWWWFKDRWDKEKFYVWDYPSEYLLNKWEMLIAMTEQAPWLLWSTLFIPENNKYLHNQRLWLVSFNKEDLSSWYVYYYFNNANIRKLIHHTAVWTKVRHTSPSKLQDLSISIPPIWLQNKFWKKLDNITKNLYSHAKALIDLDQLLAQQMQESFHQQ